MAETVIGSQTEAAWKQAGDERRETPAPTGDAVGRPEDERARIRMLMQANPALSDIDPRTAFRAPGGVAAPEEPAAPPRPQPKFEPEAEVQAPAPAVNDGEGETLEREILGGPAASEIPEIPDTTVKIGGSEIPLSRLRAGQEALARRDEWNAALTQKEQALARSNDLMVEAAREFKRDPVNALEKIGVDKKELLAQMRASGLLAESEAPSVSSTTPDLGEDADPLARALLKENRALKARLDSQDNKLDSVTRQLKQEAEQRQAAALRQQHAAALSGVKSEIASLASKMPSMTDAPGKLNPTGKLLVETVDTKLRQEVAAYGGVIDPAQLKQRAVALFSAQARDAGITPKAVQARNALSRQKPPVPTRVGTTLAPASAEPGEKPRKAFDFSNDEARRAAIAQWFEANAE